MVEKTKIQKTLIGPALKILPKVKEEKYTPPTKPFDELNPQEAYEYAKAEKSLGDFGESNGEELYWLRRGIDDWYSSQEDAEDQAWKDVEDQEDVIEDITCESLRANFDENHATFRSEDAIGPGEITVNAQLLKCENIDQATARALLAPPHGNLGRAAHRRVENFISEGEEHLQKRIMEHKDDFIGYLMDFMEENNMNPTLPMLESDYFLRMALDQNLLCPDLTRLAQTECNFEKMPEGPKKEFCRVLIGSLMRKCSVPLTESQEEYWKKVIL